MDQWILFGFGNYLSDIFDIIHANTGKIKAVVKNFDPSYAEMEMLKKRISFTTYDVPVIPLNQFQPSGNVKYMYGFHTGRCPVIHDLVATYNINFSSLVHPSVVMGSNIRMGMGVCIGPNSVIGPNVELGNFTSVNRASSIGHDTILGECVTINPGVSIAGMVTIGDRTMVGIGAVIIDGIQIGKNSIIGAGAVVVKDVPDNVVVVGVPAKIIRGND